MIFGLSVLTDLDGLQEVNVSNTPLNNADTQTLKEKGIAVINETILPAVQKYVFYK